MRLLQIPTAITPRRRRLMAIDAVNARAANSTRTRAETNTGLVFHHGGRSACFVNENAVYELNRAGWYRLPVDQHHGSVLVQFRLGYGALIQSHNSHATPLELSLVFSTYSRAGLYQSGLLHIGQALGRWTLVTQATTRQPAGRPS